MPKARWIVIVLWLGCAPLPASDALPPVKLVEVADLASDAALIRRQRVPMMLEFAAADCSYCELLEEELLKPMLRNAGYRSLVLIRKLDIHEPGYIRDFDGTRIAASELVERYHIEVTPTLVFLDAEGAELGNRIVGVRSMDFFGGVVDTAIEATRDELLSVSVQSDK